MSTRTLIVGSDNSDTLIGTAGNELIYGFNPDGPQGQVSSITANRVATGLSQPLFAASPPGDYNRLFIVEKTGQIKILDLTTGQILPTPFLDLSSQITTVGEGGVLGLAFDPDFVHNGRFFVDITNTNDDTEVRSYHVSAGNPNQADPATASLVIGVDQPNGLTNHKGGWLGFGPDGDLYVALGDGGGGGDPSGNGQNINTLLGKMLRLNVNGDDFRADNTKNYAIPADNPFVGTAGADEIWAFGLRNPFRDSFDDGLGTFFIADVGQDTWEEIDIGQLGANYGWNAFEGPAPFPGGGPAVGPTTAPIFSYNHTVGQSIIGGYVYRGPSEGLQGQYFFADFVAGKVFTLRFDGPQWVATDRTSQVIPDAGAINNPSSFGEDGAGNLYIVDLDGDVFRLTPNVTSADQGDSLIGMGGNDMLFGGSGNDTVVGGGNDLLQGGNGNDLIVANGAVGDTAFGGSGDDVMNAVGAGAERLDGGAGNDRIHALGSGNDTLIGGTTDAGNDFLYVGGAGTDQLLAGDGNDTLAGAGSGTYASDAGNGNDVIYALGVGTETASGGAGNDLIAALGNGNYLLDGGLGNDSINATGAGTDTLLGGDGNDFLSTGRGTESLAGGNGDDRLFFSSSSGNNDSLDGGSGTDTVIFQGKVQANIANETTAMTGVTTIVFDAASGGQTAFVQDVETLQFQDGSQQHL